MRSPVGDHSDWEEVGPLKPGYVMTFVCSWLRFKSTLGITSTFNAWSNRASFFSRRQRESKQNPPWIYRHCTGNWAWKCNNTQIARRKSIWFTAKPRLMTADPLDTDYHSTSIPPWFNVISLNNVHSTSVWPVERLMIMETVLSSICNHCYEFSYHFNRNHWD